MAVPVADVKLISPPVPSVVVGWLCQTTFTNSTIATVDSDSHHTFPYLAANVSGSEIYLVYKSGTETLFKRSDDGTNFTPDRDVLDTAITIGNSQPEIAIGLGGNVFHRLAT